MDNKTIIDWNNKKPIRDLINQLIDLESKGYIGVELVTEKEGYEPEGCEGEILYESTAKLKIS